MQTFKAAVHVSYFSTRTWQSRNEPPGAVNNSNFCVRVSGFVLVRLQRCIRHWKCKHLLVSRGEKHPLSCSLNAGVGLRAGCSGTQLLPSPRCPWVPPGWDPAAPRPGTHSWWSCRWLEPQPAWAPSPRAAFQKQVAAAWE